MSNFKTFKSFFEEKEPSDKPEVKTLKQDTEFKVIPDKDSLANKVSPDKDLSKPKIRVAEKSDKAFGDMATPSLSKPSDNIPGGEKPSYEGLTTEAFIKATAGMSDQEFMTFMLTESKKKDDSEVGIPHMMCQFSGKPVVPTFYEVARYMAAMLPHNENARRTFIRELLETGDGLNSLLSEMLNYNEVYDGIVDQMGLDGSKVSKRLVRSMNESHLRFMDEMANVVQLQTEAVDSPIDQRMPTHNFVPPMNAPTNNSMSPVGGIMGGSTAMPPMPQVPSMTPMSPSATGMAPPPPGMHGIGNNMPPMPNANSMQSANPHTPNMNMKLNKEFAYHHMIREMAKFDPMSSVMREVLANSF